MAKPTEQKVLRVAIVHGGWVMEERFFRKPQPITIGQAEKNTFAVPVERLPAAYRLFELRAGQYWLRFVRGMEGRVSLPGKASDGGREAVVDLKALVSKGLAQKDGEHYVFALTPEMRGRVVLGDVVVLFQFVVPPPQAKTLHVPLVSRDALWKRLDHLFVAILVLSFIGHFGSAGGLSWWWTEIGQYEATRIQKRPRKVEQIRVEFQHKEDEPEQVAEAEEEVVAEGVGPAATTEAPVETAPAPDLTPQKVKPAHDKPAKPETAEQRYQRQLSRVKKQSMLGELEKLGGPRGGGAGGNALAIGGGSALDDAWATRAGTPVGGPGGSRVYQGLPQAAAGEGEGDGDGTGGAYRKLTQTEKYSGAIRTGPVKTAEKGPEVKVKVKVGGDLGQSTGTGQIDKQSVAGVFRRRRSAIQRCYESVLQKKPTVQGKVTIQFTIGPAGRITDIKVTGDTTGEKAIGECIVARVRSWRFDPPERGNVTFSYPFILSRG